MKMNKLTFIGMCIWISIWIFSKTVLGETIINDPKNIVFTISIIIVMIIGIILQMIGIYKIVNMKNTEFRSVNTDIPTEKQLRRNTKSLKKLIKVFDNIINSKTPK